MSENILFDDTRRVLVCPACRIEWIALVDGMRPTGEITSFLSSVKETDKDLPRQEDPCPGCVQFWNPYEKPGEYPFLNRARGFGRFE